jgi:8-oxo-dGTP pyrophosphatase MutT (NUDIX family)
MGGSPTTPNDRLPARGTAHERRMSRHFAADPTQVRLSVSAVVRPRPGADEILLMRQSDNGCWGLPGGYEPGEPVAEATAREVFEETGVRVEVGGLPEPLVPIHGIRVADALDASREARVR